MEYKPAIFVYFDGSFKKFENGTSTSSIGFYIETQGGEELESINKSIDDINSNTEAEYKSLEMALKKVLDEYGENNRLFVFGDEKTIINKLNDEPHSNDNIIINSIRKISEKFNSVIFTHISQSENKKAHKLSNNALKNNY